MLAAICAFLIFALFGDCESAHRMFRAGFATAVAIVAVRLLDFLLPF